MLYAPPPGASLVLAILPILCFVLVLLCLRQAEPRRDPRRLFLKASVVWGLIVLLITELLSSFRALTALGVASCWVIAALATFIIGVKWRAFAVTRLVPPRVPLGFVALALPSVAIVLLAGLTALLGWPNTWDAMTYHLSRVAHWTQNQSVAHYSTVDQRQLYMPPWAEFAILQLTLLAGDDRAANLVQWFSMFGSVVGVSLIAGQLGATARGQLFSALFCATLPMGILQASSTQNDYVGAFWLVCLTSALLDLRASPGCRISALSAGASMGLALLSKSTTPLYAAPLLLLLLGCGLVQRPALLLKRGAVAGLIALAINAPHFARNAELYGWILAPIVRNSAGESRYLLGVANESPSLPILASNVIRNSVLHLSTPHRGINQQIERGVRSLHNWLGIDVNDSRSTWLGLQGSIDYDVPPATTSEVRAGNSLHFVLILVATAIVATSGRLRGSQLAFSLAAALLLGFLLFNVLLKWQPWGSRFQLAAFILSAPLVALAVESRARLLASAALILAVGAIPFTLFNWSHPLIGGETIFSTTRVDQYFRNRPEIRQAYERASDYLQANGCNQIGLLLDRGDYEYPLWPLLQPHIRREGRLEHVGLANASAPLSEQRFGAFAPCAILAVRGKPIGTYVLNGVTYSGAWSTRGAQVLQPAAPGAARSP